MSFTGDIVKELSALQIKKTCCRRSLAFGMALGTAKVEDGMLVSCFYEEAAAKHFCELLEKNLERCVRIPMLENLRSLNLSNSVAIAVYEILRQWNFEGMQEEGELTKFNW